MSVVEVRTYFRNAMDGLGHIEWQDGFNFSNIPDNILDRSYHITSGRISGDIIAHRPMKLSSEVALRLFVKGYSGPQAAIDQALAYGEDILCEVLATENRAGTVIININFVDMAVNPVADSNDNDVVLEMNFTAISYMET